MAQWLRLHAAHAGGVDLVPDWGAHGLCGVAPTTCKKKKKKKSSSLSLNSGSFYAKEGGGAHCNQSLSGTHTGHSLTGVHLPRPYYNVNYKLRHFPLTVHHWVMGKLLGGLGNEKELSY